MTVCPHSGLRRGAARATAIMLGVAPCLCVRANLARALPVDMHRLLRGLSGDIRDLRADHLGGGRSIPVAAQSSHVLRRPETGAIRALCKTRKNAASLARWFAAAVGGSARLQSAVVDSGSIVSSVILPVLMLMMEMWRPAAIRSILLFGLVVWYIFGGSRC